MSTYIGVDVGGTNVRALADRDGVRSSVAARPLPATFDDLVATVRDLTSQVTDVPVAAVGVALPGRTDARVPQWIPNVPYLDGEPLADRLEATLAAPVHLANDGRVTLLAEWREGAAAGVDNAVLVTIGTGIGGAVLLDGRIVRGATGTLGSVGWLPADAPGRRDDQGPWETVASGSALAVAAQPWGGVGHLITAVRDGDAAARAALETYSARLGRGIAALASVLDPGVIVLAGGVSRVFDLLHPMIVDTMTAEASPTGASVPVALAHFGPDAGVVGSLLLAKSPEVIA